MRALLVISLAAANALAFEALMTQDEARARAFATSDGARLVMTGKGDGSDGSKYPPENVFDGDCATFTCAQRAPSPGAPIEIGWDFGAPVKVNCYRMHFFSTAGNAGFPKDWTLEGSNDGTQWTVLDERRDRHPTQRSWHAFHFAGGAAFSQYRLKVTEGLSPRRFDLAELELGFEERGGAAVDAGAKTLRLATYNIHHGEPKGGKYDVARSLAAVEATRQDLIGLNEVDWRSKRVGGADTPSEIERLSGMHVEYVRAKPYGGGFYGNAVLSREVPIREERIDLPRGDGRNGLKCALVLCEFTDCWFGATHFDLRANLSNQLASVEILRRVVEEKAKDKPVFLCGDWNNEPDSEPLAKVRELMTVISDERARTYNGFKVPEDAPQDETCIDYIAVDSAHADKVFVSETAVKHDFASDHNPVFVEVLLLK